jgi:hypothetical protein
MGFWYNWAVCKNQMQIQYYPSIVTFGGLIAVQQNQGQKRLIHIEDQFGGFGEIIPKIALIINLIHAVIIWAVKFEMGTEQ